jgi:diaminopimelate decarboxylase
VYNGLFEVMAYQGSTAYPVHLRRASQESGKQFSVAGPTGDGPDVTARDVILPADVRPGDQLIFENVGAYSCSVTTSFNGFTKPPLHEAVPARVSR